MSERRVGQFVMNMKTLHAKVCARQLIYDRLRLPSLSPTTSSSPSRNSSTSSVLPLPWLPTSSLSDSNTTPFPARAPCNAAPTSPLHLPPKKSSVCKPRTLSDFTRRIGRPDDRADLMYSRTGTIAASRQASLISLPLIPAETRTRASRSKAGREGSRRERCAVSSFVSRSVRSKIARR